MKKLKRSPGKWVLGALAQSIWSYAVPSDAASVNKFLFQCFINDNLFDGWYLTMMPVMTADWQKDSRDRWTIPLGESFCFQNNFSQFKTPLMV